MTTTNYINSGYITKMGDASTNDGTAGRPVDSVDFPHSGLIKALNIMASTGHTVLNGSIGSGSKNFNMDMDDTTSSGYTTITVRVGTIVREGVLVSISQATLTEIASGSPSDVQFIEQGSSGENFYHLIVVNSSNVIKIRNPAAKDKVADLTVGDIPIAVLRAQNSETPTARHLQYLTTDVQSNSLSIAYDNSDVYTEAMNIKSSSVGDVTIKNIVQDKDIIFNVNDGSSDTEVMRIDGSTSKVGIGTDAPSSLLHVAGTGIPTIKLEDTDTAGGYAHLEVNGSALFIESYDEDGTVGSIIFKNATTEAMRIKDSGKVGIGETAPDAPLHVKSAGNDTTIMLESTDTDANAGPVLELYRNTGSSGEDSNLLGKILFTGQDDGPAKQEFGEIVMFLNDESAGSEDGEMLFKLTEGGSTGQEYMRLRGGSRQVEINANTDDIDFVVNGDTVSNLVFTDASTDRVSIGGNTSPLALLSTKGNMDTAISGTVTTTDGSAAISQGSSSTSFLSELRAGQAIKIGSQTKIIAAVASDTAATITEVFTSAGSGVVTNGTAYIDDVLLLMEDGNGTDVLGIRNNSMIALQSGIINSVRVLDDPLAGIASTLYATDNNIIVNLAGVPMPAVDYDFTLYGNNVEDIGRIFTIQCVAIGGGAPFEGTGVDIILAGSDVLYDVDNAVLANSSTRLQLVAGKSYTILQEKRNIFRVVHKTV